MIKKILLGLCTIPLMVTTITNHTIHTEADKANNIYALTTIVIAVDYATDTVECEDANENLWEFYGCEDWQVDDTCTLTMDDNGTSEIYDDIIVNAKYSAFTINK